MDANSRWYADAESCYAVTELELAAVEWAVRKNRLYLLGLLSFTIAVDHQALFSILDQQPLDSVDSPKIQRLKEWLALNVFTIVSRRGKVQSIPDAISCAHVNDPLNEDVAFVEDDV